MVLEFWFVVYDMFQSRRQVAEFWKNVLPARPESHDMEGCDILV